MCQCADLYSAPNILLYVFPLPTTNFVIRLEYPLNKTIFYQADEEFKLA